ncbi:MAG: pyrroline-5-carboxylate reductase [Pseudomonadota bacterium]
MDLRDAVQSLLLLGCGKMGGAMLEGWLAGGLAPDRVQVIEPNPVPRLTALAGQGLALNPATPSKPAVAVLAVKPQMMGAALPAVAGFGGGGTLVLSIAAGTPLAAFEAAFGTGTPVVRAMPNTPAAIGRGITAIVANAAAGEAGLAQAEALLAPVSTVVRLDAESQMDAVTGVSGSGPAYVFHLIEALAAAGEAEGLSATLAMRLARATVIGAGALAAASSEGPDVLRRNVTSPGGTTAAGLDVLMPALPDLMRRTVAAAAGRSRALARED